MSTSTPLPIPHHKITHSQVRACIHLYPAILERVYKVTRPKANLDEILEDDKWKYEVLPELLKDGRALEKEELARLVKWKITHGINRPFLPAMIEKNTSTEISAATTKLSATLSSLPSTSRDSTTQLISTALSQVTMLKGVGPATGTLVLSVYAPAWVPFFEDELFEWLSMQQEGKGKEKVKLKYDLKEYAVVLNGVLDMLERIGGNLEARDVEKAGYVMGHLDVLGEDERRRILDGMVGEKEGQGKVDGRGEENGKSKDVSGHQGRKRESERDAEDEVADSAQKQVTKTKRARTQEARGATSSTAGTRRSKRVKK